MKKVLRFSIIMLSIFALVACSLSAPGSQSTPISEVASATAATEHVPIETIAAIEASSEVDVREILLSSPYNDAQMEYSGLAWLGETLVLLPQYPRRLGDDGSAFLVTIQKEAILAYLSGNGEVPIETSLLAFDDGGLSDTLDGFEGFEAIVFSGEQVFVTIETSGGSPMMGYLVSGVVDKERESIRLDPGRIVPLAPQTDFRNASDESLILTDGLIFTFFEDNGSVVNPNSYAHVFDLDLNPQPQTDFPDIEFRVTDATKPLADGSFWVMNYFYPGDAHLRADVDPIAERFGEGRTHKRSDRVERIIRLQMENGEIRLAEEAPVYLSLTPDGSSRNWEGLVRLDDFGFLAVTDSFPKTILGFIPNLR